MDNKSERGVAPLARLGVLLALVKDLGVVVAALVGEWLDLALGRSLQLDFDILGDCVEDMEDGHTGLIRQALGQFY